MTKSKVEIGLRQARVLCQMAHDKRLEFISEGLPIILASAQGFWEASRKLTTSAREAEVLAGFAEEEAAKVLILMDAVRCPPSVLPSRIGAITGWFYSHLARLIYAESVSWKPSDIAELREYVISHRKAHYVDGYAGEFIMPNWNVYEREARLYADIQTYSIEEAGWNSPIDPAFDVLTTMKQALRIAEAMEALGIFSLEGLSAASDVWAQVTFANAEGPDEANRLVEELLNRLVKEKLPRDSATQDDVDVLLNLWQLPMYDFDFSPIHVSLDDLTAEQDRMLWSEIGSPY